MEDRSEMNLRNEKVRSASFEAVLENLLISNQIRELTDLPVPVRIKDLARMSRSLTALARQAYAANSKALSKIGLLRYIIILSLLRILLRRFYKGAYPFSISQEIKRSIKASYQKMRNSDLRVSDITAYVRCSDKEEPLIRVCLLLRAMRRYGAAIEFLQKRYNSGLPEEETRKWLSLFLTEIGDKEAAAKLAPSEKPLPSRASSTTRLKYGIIITVMFDSEVFRTSLMSLLNSDFQGEIVVVEEGNNKEAVCESFCSKLPVRYIKNKRWSGVSHNVNLGIERLNPNTDIVIYAHNDIFWPPNWFGQLDHAWDKVYDLDKVGAIFLGYLQMVSADETLFTGSRYGNLSWLLKTMSEMPDQMGYVQNTQVKDTERLFGLALDPWNSDYSRLRMMTGRFSIANSFPLKMWQDIGGFDPEMSLGLEHELQEFCLKNRRWDLWINNTPLIHYMSVDTRKAGAGQVEFNALDKTNELFAKKVGWEVDHLLSTYYGEVRIIYYDEIVNAVNKLRFGDIDFVFDDALKRLKTKRLSDCEIFWCHSRNSCKYR